MDYAIVCAVALFLIVVTVVLHYEALRLTADITPRLAIRPRARILVVIAVAFFAHSIEIALYGWAYWSAGNHLGLGAISGALEGTPVDYLYFSAATFTTLGVGDLVVSGPLRIVVGLESLNGLILITWSASFTYLSMERFWLDHN